MDVSGNIFNIIPSLSLIHIYNFFRIWVYTTVA